MLDDATGGDAELATYLQRVAGYGVAHRGHTSIGLVFSTKNSVPPDAPLRVSKSRSSGRSKYRIKPSWAMFVLWFVV